MLSSTTVFNIDNVSKLLLLGFLFYFINADLVSTLKTLKSSGPYIFQQYCVLI